MLKSVRLVADSIEDNSGPRPVMGDVRKRLKKGDLSIEFNGALLNESPPRAPLTYSTQRRYSLERIR